MKLNRQYIITYEGMVFKDENIDTSIWFSNADKMCIRRLLRILAT